MSMWVQLCLSLTLSNCAPCITTTCDPHGSPMSVCECRCEQRGEWVIVDTESFSVWSKLPVDDAVQLATRCEALRIDICRTWCRDEVAAWRPQCVVVLHSDAAEFAESLGTGASRSVGCTTITCEGDQVVFRRIDVRCDALNWRINALPHELTHVVMADLYPGATIPSWINEGMAMMSEGSELQRQRLETLRRARQNRKLPSVVQLLENDSDMTATEVDVRYAMNLSLVLFLQRRGDEEQWLSFVDRVLRDGHDSALSETYSLEGGVAELQGLWQVETAASPEVSLQ